MIPCEYQSACYQRRQIPTRQRCWRTRTVEAHTSGMTFSTAVVWTFLLATSCRVSAEQQRRNAPLTDASVYMPELEEQVDLADVLDQGGQELDESENEERLQKLAGLLSLLRSTLNERQQGQAEDSQQQQLSGVYPPPLPLIKDEDKRGSYMTLCHFKICNMGRKRNLRLSPFMRM